MNSESCPGETKCSTKKKGRIYEILKREPEKEVEQICQRCPLLPTKPGREPIHLSQAIQIATELDEDSLVCGGFNYPDILDYLDPLEYACLVAIKAARRDSENKSLKEQRERDARDRLFGQLDQVGYGK